MTAAGDNVIEASIRFVLFKSRQELDIMHVPIFHFMYLAFFLGRKDMCS